MDEELWLDYYYDDRDEDEPDRDNDELKEQDVGTRTRTRTRTRNRSKNRKPSATAGRPGTAALGIQRRPKQDNRPAGESNAQSYPSKSAGNLSVANAFIKRKTPHISGRSDNHACNVEYKTAERSRPEKEINLLWAGVRIEGSKQVSAVNGKKI